MAEPFVFHFRSGPTGPEQMYIADIRAECALCRHVQVQRYYHATPLHTVTLRTVRDLALGVGAKLAYDCPNCGEPVRPEHALSTAFTWGFADDSGLVRGFLPDAHDAASLRWQFEQRRLDPQDLPGWAPDPAAPSFAALDDAAIEQHCGRVLNPKTAIRDVLEAWRDDPRGGAVATIARDMYLIATSDDATVEQLLAQLDHHPDEHVVIALADSAPEGLATHRDPAAMIGQLHGWLPPDVDLDKVFVMVAPASVDAAFERAFRVANLTYERTATGIEAITTPRDSRYPRAVTTRSVLRRAAYTGLTPGDAARLTAEEIVGNLLRVW